MSSSTAEQTGEVQIRLFSARELSEEHVAAWRRLAETEIGLDHPLLSPTWIQTTAAVQRPVEVAVISENDRLVGFLPFERHGSQGYPVGGSLSDHHALIAPASLQVDPADVVRQCRLTALHFDHLPFEQPWFAPHTARIEDAAIVVLNEGFENYWRERREASPSWTRQFERKSRKLAREVGRLQLVWHDTNPASVDALVDWKRRQLRSSSFGDIFANPSLRPHMESLIASEAAECQGVLSTLSAGDHLVAVHFGIRNCHTMVSSIPAYSEQFQTYSPGAILHVEMTRAAAERGIHTIDLGRGINPLKQALASTTRKLAIGVVDLQPTRRWCRNCWFRLRDFVHASPWGRLPIQAYREVRRFISCRG